MFAISFVKGEDQSIFDADLADVFFKKWPALRIRFQEKIHRKNNRELKHARF